VEITEVRIKLMEDNSGSNERLQAFCSITFDDMFVIRDLKIIEGAKGFFVAMPSRKLTPPERPRPIGPVLEALAGGDSARLGSCLFNRLQSIAEALRPELVGVADALGELCPSILDGHLMSGSGSAYFGLAPDRIAAEVAASRLESLGHGRVRVVTCGT